MTNHSIFQIGKKQHAC